MATDMSVDGEPPPRPLSYTLYGAGLTIELLGSIAVSLEIYSKMFKV
jgi:hypothetical protein